MFTDYEEHHVIGEKIVTLHRLVDRARHDEYLDPAYDYAYTVKAAGRAAQDIADHPEDWPWHSVRRLATRSWY